MVGRAGRNGFWFCVVVRSCSALHWEFPRHCRWGNLRWGHGWCLRWSLGGVNQRQSLKKCPFSPKLKHFWSFLTATTAKVPATPLAICLATAYATVFSVIECFVQASTIWLMVSSESRGKDLKIALHWLFVLDVAIFVNTSCLVSGLSVCLSRAVFSQSTNWLNDSSFHCLMLVKFWVGMELSGVRSRVVLAAVAMSFKVALGRCCTWAMGFGSHLPPVFVVLLGFACLVPLNKWIH